MKNLIKIDLTTTFINSKNFLQSIENRSIDQNKSITSMIESITKGDDAKAKILLDYVKIFNIFAIDLETLEIVAGSTKDKKNFINEEYYKRFEENQLIDMSENFMYMEYSYVCTWNGNKIWGKYKKEFGGGHTINWEHYPVWGSRKARILDLLLDDE